MKGSYLCWGSRQGVADPGQCNHIARVYTRYHQHHCQISGCPLDRSGCNDECDDCKIERESDVEISFSCSIGMPGVKECGNDPEDVRRDSQEEGVDVAVAQSPNDRGEKVGDGARGDEAEQQYHLEAD